MSSACVPFSTTTPSATTRITSELMMVDNRWAIAKEVLPSLAFSSASCTTVSLCESKALVASSSRSTGGSRTNALQIATRCFWPPESLEPLRPTIVSQPWLSSASRKLRLAMRLQASSFSSEMLDPSSRP
mmetsp:Transcript_6490/g.18629  ORF Transcript_6490/g.18629 Transcript_6490/m.18629 type:complete len:130 (+) Transcript_6490:284-673(+)